MSSLRSLGAINAYLAAQAASRSRTEIGEAPGTRRFVTVSRLAGAGAHAVGEHLAGILNREHPGAQWMLFDQDLIEAVLELHDLPRELSRFMPEDRINTFVDTVEAVLGLHPSSDTLVRKTNEAILTLAGIGNVIIVGRGGNALTRSLRNGVHVRLVADEATRLQNIATHHGVDMIIAQDLMRKTDEGRKRYLRDRFREDIDDPLGYDIVINTTRIDHRFAAEMIAARVRRPCSVGSP
jgi:cytidylate kinase